MRLTSPAFEHNGAIPSKYTCDGSNVSPPLVIGGVPPETRGLVLLVDDPDAPGGTFRRLVAAFAAPEKQAAAKARDRTLHEYQMSSTTLSIILPAEIPS
jgi:phosphatidylethanolamine-binding protein (PEBP) family uncharacterized protein